MTKRSQRSAALSRVNVAESNGNVKLQGQLLKLYVSEGGTYEGEVRVKLDLTSPGDEVLWSGIVNGANVHWGRSYKLDNYEETISDMLIDLAQKLTADPGLVRAIAR